MGKVLFISSRPLGRCENITAVYDAWSGDKQFEIMKDRSSASLSNSQAEYDLVITDEFVKESKAPVIMIGHGLSGGKEYGLQKVFNSQAEQDILKRCAQFTTYSLATSEFMVPTVAEQGGIEHRQVLPFGMPRTDAYFNEDGSIKTKPSWAEDTHQILYAPTFRRFEDTELPDIDLHKIDDLLIGTDYTFIVKPHMIFKGKLEHKPYEYKHVKFAHQNHASTDFLLEADVVVTDYSSIMLDALLLNRPVVLFEKDWDWYKRHAGMTLPYPQGYSSRHCTTEEDLVWFIKRIIEKGEGLRERDLLCRKLTSDCCDGHSTERLINFMKNFTE